MIGTFTKTIAAAATPERLSATRQRVSWVTIQSTATNTKPAIVGSESTAASGYELGSSGDSIVFWSTAGRDLAIDLYDIWIKVGADGEKVNVLYVKA